MRPSTTRHCLQALHTQTTSHQAAAARQAAYRRLAVSILGLDVRTLSADLRAQREAATSHLSLVPPAPKAA